MNIWVIGGDSGIGLSCAVTLSPRHHVRATGKNVDVTSRSALVEYSGKMGPFHALVYSAGVSYLEWHDHIDPIMALKSFSVNALGLLRAIRAYKDAMPKWPLEKIVVIGSDAAWTPMRTSSIYCASKAALQSIVLCIARETAADEPKFRINLVAPGKIENTPMTDAVEEQTERIRGWTSQELRAYELSKMPMGRYGHVEEVSEVVRWLLEDAPDYMNGQIITVNGGR